MKKERHFHETKFAPETIRRILDIIEGRLPAEIPRSRGALLRVTFPDATWTHDSLDEFFADYRRRCTRVYMDQSVASSQAAGLSLSFSDYCTDVTVTAPSRELIEAAFECIEEAVPTAKYPRPPEAAPKPEPRIFIGHGRDSQWRQLKDHLQDQHGYSIVAYEVGARAGHGIRDVLEDMLDKSSFALLVLTGEDRDADNSLHARENVIHELGLFQGRLGFRRAIALLEDDVTEFSNLHGIQQLRFGRGRIQEVFGDVLATLRRELSPT